MKLKNEYLYCVVQKTGHLCLWSMAGSRRWSWLRFKSELLEFKNLSVEEARKKAKADGARCVRVRVMLAEEMKGK